MPPPNNLEFLHEWDAKNRAIEDAVKAQTQYSELIKSASEAQKRFTEYLGPIAELQKRISEAASVNSGAIARLQNAVAEAASWTSRIASPITEQMERF